MATTKIALAISEISNYKTTITNTTSFTRTVLTLAEESIIIMAKEKTVIIIIIMEEINSSIITKGELIPILNQTIMLMAIMETLSTV